MMQSLALTLSRAADRSQAAHALSLLVGERASDRYLSGTAAHLVTTDRRRRFFDLWPGAPPRPSYRLFLLLQRNSHLARRSQRRYLGGRCLTGTLGHLAPRFFLFA